jgi:hypothetical protein
VNRKVCILGVHHAYQYQVVRRAYFQEVKSLIEIHNVDLVAEEASGISKTFVQELLEKLFPAVVWSNVDLTSEERKGLPDANPLGVGTLVDFDFNMARERAWVERTSKVVKNSALLICGYCHVFSVAEKFRAAGFEVEINVFFDKDDEPKRASSGAEGLVGSG